MDELLQQFLIEGRELVVQAGGEVAALQKSPSAAARLDGLFRNLHTLKGSAAVFDLPALTGLLHAAESQLDLARGAGRLEAGLARGVLRALDICEAWLDGLERGAEPSRRLIEDTRTAEAALGEASKADEVVVAAHREGEVPAWAEHLAAGVAREGALTAIRYVPSEDAYFRGDDPVALLSAVPGLVAVEVKAAATTGEIYDPYRCTLQLHALSTADEDTVRGVFRLVSDQVDLATIEAASATAATDARLRTLRVEAAQLDRVAALADELVIAKNALLHAGMTANGGSGDAGAAAALERAVSALHGAVTDLRLIPLQAVFSRFPRQVREVAEALGKSVAFEMRGERVVLDKAVVEGLYEPLLHLLRNALDHGVEPAEQRVKLGKPAQARLTLSAETRAGEVEIRLEDDGRGVDVARVRGLAVERGLISASKAGAMSDEEAALLVFAPGFSTARRVSALSGRGVGLDAVQVAVDRMGGRIDLVNRPGEGLAVSLALPAHVLLTKALTVTAGGERFGAAMASIGETHRVRADEVTAIRAGRAFVRRDTVIPLLRLGDLLGAPAGPDRSAFPVLTIQTVDGPVGLQVDSIGEQVEAPLRPLGGLLARFPGMLGTILQGDGGVLLVLDLQALAA